MPLSFSRKSAKSDVRPPEKQPEEQTSEKLIDFSDLPPMFNWQCEACGHTLTFRRLEDIPSRCPMCGYRRIN
jgi:rubrerythrin